MKKNLFLVGMLMIAGAASAGSRVTDNFDWGTGVAGRESLTGGQALADGTPTQTGGAAWTVNAANSTFSGTSGQGNGTLTQTGSIATANFGYVPAGGWMSGVVVATMTARFTPGAGSVKSLQMGFQNAATNTMLLSNQKTSDKLSIKMGGTGNINFASVISGTTNTLSSANNLTGFVSGDTVTFTMTVDAAHKTATVVATDVTRSLSCTNTVTWTTAAIPDWAAFAVGSSGLSTAVIDRVSVTLEPATLGLLGAAVPPRAIPII